MDRFATQKLVDMIAGSKAAVESVGQVASYIPELAAVDPYQFGLAITTADGASFVSGDVDMTFFADAGALSWISPDGAWRFSV